MRTTRCKGLRGEVLRDVPHFLNAGGLQIRPALAPKPRQFANAMVGPSGIAGAVRVVGAGVGREAMVARRDVRRLGLGEHGPHRLRLFANALLQRNGLVENRMQLEQRIDIQPNAVVHIAPVQGEHSGIAHIQPRAPQHPQLHGHVLNEEVLEIDGGLDLHQPPTALRQPLQHIRAGEDMPMLKGRFKERRRGVRLNEPLRFRQRFCYMVVVVGNQVTAGIAPASQIAHLVPGVEDELQRLADRGG